MPKDYTKQKDLYKDSYKDSYKDLYQGDKQSSVGDKGDKQSFVNWVFDKTASHYDMMNNILSLGHHHIWKHMMVKKMSYLGSQKPLTLLDVAGGTGDITDLCLKQNKHIKASILDINPHMLKQAQHRFAKIKTLDFICANAEKLPLKDQTIDIYACAFGIRNMDNRQKVLKEAKRVLKIGGQFLCLEFSHIENPFLQKLSHIWIQHIMPQLGKMIVNNQDSYDYLARSIASFPKPDRLLEEIKEAGLQNAHYQPIQNGLVAIHKAWHI